MKEICIVAAIKTPTGFIFRGQRHSDCIAIASRIKAFTQLEMQTAKQGFITSKNRFVDRKEGYQLQIAAGIKSLQDGGYINATLYSEDLY